jgi:DinB superfamily
LRLTVAEWEATMTSTAELIAEIEQAGEEYARFVETLSEAQFRRRPDPNEWTAAEITGHVSEAPLTFANHARRLAVEGGGQAGRPPDDPGRLAAVARLADRGPKEGADLVREGVRGACAVLREIAEYGWSVEGSHTRMGQMTVRGLVEASVLEHLRGHLRQAKEAAGVE